MILTRLLLKKVALGHRRTCLCHYSKMIFLQNCSLHARENLSSEPDFRWLFWQSSTWKLVKLSGTRWTWIFSKSNTIANRTKKPIHSGWKLVNKCLIIFFNIASEAIVFKWWGDDFGNFQPYQSKLIQTELLKVILIFLLKWIEKSCFRFPWDLWKIARNLKLQSPENP